MKRFYCIVAAAAALLALSTAAEAADIVNTLPANNQANLSVDAAQTFTTPTLGAENLLDFIEVEGPQADSGEFLGPFVLQLFTDADGDHGTWDPDALVATSTEGTLISGQGLGAGGLTKFTFPSLPALDDGTVYGFLWADAGGDAATARMGLTNDNAIADGTLFGEGVTQFGDAFDTAMRISTKAIPEPASLALFGLGLIGLAGAARRR